MSLIYRITTRTQQDVINQGQRLILAGSQASSVGTGTLQGGAANRGIAVYSYVFTTDSATAVRVTLSFKKAATSITIFDGYIALGGPVCHTFGFGDEQYGEEQYSLMLTTTGGNVGYTINARIVGLATPIGYIYSN